VDADTGQILASVLTTNDVDDASQVSALLDEIDISIASFVGDGAYDQEAVYTDITDATLRPASLLNFQRVPLY
jgi:hypothetical protein